MLRLGRSLSELLCVVILALSLTGWGGTEHADRGWRLGMALGVMLLVTRKEGSNG